MSKTKELNETQLRALFRDILGWDVKMCGFYGYGPYKLLVSRKVPMTHAERTRKYRERKEMKGRG